MNRWFIGSKYLKCKFQLFVVCSNVSPKSLNFLRAILTIVTLHGSGAVENTSFYLLVLIRVVLKPIFLALSKSLELAYILSVDEDM